MAAELALRQLEPRRMAPSTASPYSAASRRIARAMRGVMLRSVASSAISVIRRMRAQRTPMILSEISGWRSR